MVTATSRVPHPRQRWRPNGEECPDVRAIDTGSVGRGNWKSDTQTTSAHRDLPSCVRDTNGTVETPFTIADPPAISLGRGS